ncbi:latrophilin 3, partial [Mytilus galloprovincialis]
NGSVSVDILITVNQTGSVLENSAVLKSAIESGYLGQLAVEPWSYSITEGDGKLQVGLTVNGPFYEDAALTFTCTADIIGNVGQTTVTWTLNNVVLRPTSKSRWKIKRLQPSRLIPFRVVYQLSVNPLKVRDSGKLSCSVTDGYNLQSNRTIQMKVLGKPIVFIGPMSAGIMQGETIPVECFILSNPSEVREIKWFKNGKLFNGSKHDEVIRKGPEGTSEILTHRNIQRNVIYECLGKNEAGEGPKVMSNITVYVEGESRILCYIDTDRFGTVWNWTIAGITVVKPCKGNQRGEVSRVCNKKGVWRIPDYSSCVRKEFVSIVEEAEHLKDGVEKEVVDDILKKLTNLTKEKDVQLTSGDLTAASSTLLSVADHAKERLETVSSDQLEEFLVSANNILGDENKEDWRQLKTKQKINVTTVLKAVQNYNDAYSQSETKPFKKRIQNDNIVVEIGKVQNEDISFPDRSQSQPSWITKSKTTIKLQQSSLKKNQLVGYNTAYYRNISDLFPTSVLINSESKDVKDNIQVNSDVVNFGTYPPLPHIDPPLAGLTQPKCAFWDFKEKAWSTVGSRLVEVSDDIGTCEYDHTTNFALLMSPMGTKETGHEKSLSYISAAGCGISILFLAITLILYFRNWHRIRSDKAKILVNLCIALILSYALFLCLWAPLSDIRGLCVTIAVLLHYIFLVDFTMMLAMAIEIGIQVLYVLPTKSRVKWLIPSCWVVPAVIVGISMGVTQLEGYGDSDVCWLSVDNGLIWAFIGPALVIVLVNLVILALVIRTLFRTMSSKAGRSNQSKSTLEKTKTGVRSICVLAPLFGVTWVFGVLSMSKDLVVFQYLFAIFNSLQVFTDLFKIDRIL